MNPTKTRVTNRHESSPAHLSASTGASARGSNAINAHDIGKNAWPAFCHWLTTHLFGVETTIVRDAGSDQPVVECLERPLESLASVVSPNGVPAIHVTVRINRQPHTVEVAGPTWLRLHYNAAGFITRVEIGYGDGKVTLRFTGSHSSGSVFTANSWGE